ncbi:MAG: metalloregulator ArsR/SmtB family transcription factor [Candidatus Krumholzibacteria bacterium]|nr:metalloregulator ArsR/SmtB family transcription factor [Candidatus Krumholzibacteria bacterium]
MRGFLAVTKALSDSNRVRALMALRGRELCVCQIVELLGLASSTVSKHMSLLEQARLVERRKNGRWVYYRRPQGKVHKEASEALRWLDESLARDRDVREDAKRIREVLKIPVEELCSVGGGK